MSVWRALRPAVRRLRTMISRARFERGMDDEMRHHLDLEIEDRIRRGMTPEEARRTPRGLDRSPRGLPAPRHAGRLGSGPRRHACGSHQGARELTRAAPPAAAFPRPGGAKV